MPSNLLICQEWTAVCTPSRRKLQDSLQISYGSRNFYFLPINVNSFFFCKTQKYSPGYSSSVLRCSVLLSLLCTSLHWNKARIIPLWSTNAYSRELSNNDKQIIHAFRGVIDYLYSRNIRQTTAKHHLFKGSNTLPSPPARNFSIARSSSRPS